MFPDVRVNVLVTTSEPVVTVSVRAPRAAAASIVSVQVIAVALGALVAETVTPDPETVTTEEPEKFVLVPTIVIGTACPGRPLDGERLEIDGTTAVTVNVLVTTSDPVVTVRVRAPAVADPEIVSVQVIDVEDGARVEETETPVPDTVTTDDPLKFVLEPVMVIGTVDPCTPLEGEMLDRDAPPPRAA